MHIGVGRIRLVARRCIGLEASVPSWMLASDLPVFLITWASPWGNSRHGRWFPSERAREGARDGEQDGSQSPIVNLILEMTPYCFCYILFIKSNPLDPAHLLGEGITGWCEYWELGIVGRQFRSWLPQHRITRSDGSYLL